jgi:septum formation protein
MLGVDFVLRAVDVSEDSEGQPAEVALANARRKALAAVASPRELVLGVDTVVALGDRIWGKPADEAAALQTLRALSGATHEVVSAIALVRDGEVRMASETTRVTFRELDEPTRAWYLASGEWLDRAGGYAIQGRGGALVRRIEGDFLNVVGLPVGVLLDLCPALL